MESQPPDEEKIESLKARMAELETRMIKGEQYIQAARDQGDAITVARYEQHWLQYLREYEEVCDQLVALNVML
jgi:hypothetical protein